MTEDQQEKQGKNLIPNPVNQALLAGGASGLASLAASLFFDVPGEQAFKMASGVFLSGSCYSLYISWSDNRNKGKPRKRTPRGRQIPFNHGRGTQKIDMEYSVEQGGYVLRETYFQAFKRKIYGHPARSMPIRTIEEIARPEILDEFIFWSQGVQLRKVHVDLFLKSAWRNRANGKGLSKRRWVRDFSQRPAWYKELSPAWFFAIRQLLYSAQEFTGQQLIIEQANQWSMLAIEPYQLIRILKWYEYERRK